jgi:apolipoprotein N-acyltransferase
MLAFATAIGHWLPGGLSFYFDRPPILGWLTFLVMVSVMMAPYTMLFAATYAWLSRRGAPALPLLAAAAWASSEWLRGALFGLPPYYLGNPWGLLGYSQASLAPLIQIADVTGVYGVSFCVLLVNAALAEGWRAWRAGELTPKRAAGLTAAAAPTLAALVYGSAVLARSEEARSHPDAAPVAVVQGHLGLAERWHRYHHARNLKTYLRLSNEILESSGAGLVVWPEAAMTFILEDEPQYQRSLTSLLRHHDAELVSGIPRRGQRDDEYFNSVYLLSPQGERTGRYDKRYLVPFAETLPFESEWVRRQFGRFREYSRGPGKPEPLPTRIGPAGVLVCNETVLSGATRRRVLEGAEFLINPSNDSWSRHPKFTGQWYDVIRFRAIETRRYVVRASTSGPSGIIDPWGRATAATERYERGVTSGWIVPTRQRSIYTRVGDVFTLLCALSVGLGALLSPGMRPGSSRLAALSPPGRDR